MECNTGMTFYPENMTFGGAMSYSTSMEVNIGTSHNQSSGKMDPFFHSCLPSFTRMPMKAVLMVDIALTCESSINVDIAVAS